MLVGLLTVRRQGGTGDGRSRQEGAGRRARRRVARERALAGRAADGGRGLRVDRRRARRAATGGSRDASQRLSPAAMGYQGGRDRVADPEDPPGVVLPELPGAAEAL